MHNKLNRPTFKIYVFELHMKFGLDCFNKLNVMHIYQSYINETSKKQARVCNLNKSINNNFQSAFIYNALYSVIKSHIIS